MSLATAVLLDGPITGQDAYHRAVAAVHKAANRLHEAPDVPWTFEPRGSIPEWLSGETLDPDQLVYWTRNTDVIASAVGWGAPARTIAYFIDGGTIPARFDEDHPDVVIQQPATVEIRWETDYGYSDGQGLNMTRLHVLALIHLAASMPAGVTLRWLNEFTGTWGEGLDRADLAAFVRDGHANGEDWFDTTCAPLLPADLVEEFIS